MSCPSPPFPAPPGTDYLSTVAGVDLWGIDLDLVDAGAAALLAPEERARARRFAFEHLRRRFTAGRVAVRRILGGYLGRDPQALAFLTGAHGKPELAGGPQFNFSGSEGRGLLGVERERPVGVDLECLREVPDAASIAATVFTPEERALWLGYGADTCASFLRVWTRKEARLKALGVGLTGERPAAGERVEVVEVECWPGFVAAAAVCWDPVR